MDELKMSFYVQPNEHMSPCCVCACIRDICHFLCYTSDAYILKVYLKSAHNADQLDPSFGHHFGSVNWKVISARGFFSRGCKLMSQILWHFGECQSFARYARKRH